MNGEHQPADEMANVCHFASFAFVNQLFQIRFSGRSCPHYLCPSRVTAVAVHTYNFGFALCCHQHRLGGSAAQPRAQGPSHSQLTDSSHSLLRGADQPSLPPSPQAEA